MVSNPANNRSSQQNMTHGGSRSSKNAIGMTNLSSLTAGPTSSGTAQGGSN